MRPANDAKRGTFGRGGRDAIFAVADGTQSDEFDDEDEDDDDDEEGKPRCRLMNDGGS